MSRLWQRRSRWDGVLGLYLGLLIETLQVSLKVLYSTCQRPFAGPLPRLETT